MAQCDKFDSVHELIRGRFGMTSAARALGFLRVFSGWLVEASTIGSRRRAGLPETRVDELVGHVRSRAVVSGIAWHRVRAPQSSRLEGDDSPDLRSLEMTFLQ